MPAHNATVRVEDRRVVLAIDFDQLIGSMSGDEMQELAGVLCGHSVFLDAAVDLLLDGSTQSGTFFDSIEVGRIRQRIASRFNDAARLAMAEELREEAGAWRSCAMAEERERAVERSFSEISRNNANRGFEYDAPSISRREVEEALRVATNFKANWELACNDYRVKRCEEMYRNLKWPPTPAQAETVDL